MTRYFFDIRNGDDISADEEGMEFPSQKAAEIEATRFLADMAREMAPASGARCMSLRFATKAYLIIAHL